MKIFSTIWSLLIIFILFSSCSNQQEEYVPESFTGRYKIVSFTSDQGVDLNHDGIISTNLMSEIVFSSNYDLDIRPLTEIIDKHRFLYFSLPKTNLTFEFTTNRAGSVSFTSYGYSTEYVFQDDFIILQDTSYIEKGYIDNELSDRLLTLNENIQLIDQDRAQLNVSKEYYDFRQAAWLPLNIEIIYEKIEL